MTDLQRTRIAQTLVVLGLLCTTVLCDTKTVSDAAGLIEIFKEEGDNPIADEITITASTLDFQGFSILPLGARDDGTCRPFSGTLIGYGRYITNLVMDNTGRKFQGAGLFCELTGNANIFGITLDRTCNFTGSNASAISVKVTGPVSFVSVTVEAEVHGSAIAGGFAATVGSLPYGENITIESCVSNGNVNGKTKGQSDIGGFVGLVTGNDEASFIVKESGFHGSLFCDSFTCNMGGFIGSFRNNGEAYLEFINSESVISKATDSVNGQLAFGGFVGLFESIPTISIFGTDTTLGGRVVIDSEGSNSVFGGLAGKVTGGLMTSIILKRVKNTMELQAHCGSLLSGGLFGYKPKQSNDYQYRRRPK